MEFALGVGVLVYLAFVFDLFGFMARDELWLRLLMLAASALYLVYYYVVADAPLWDALITNGALALVNLIMIGVVVTERTTFAMSAETAAIYRHFPMMTPGQFRKLHRAAIPLETERTLTVENAPLTRLYFLSEGTAQLNKGKTTTALKAPCFVGEVAFVTHGSASATVKPGPGACGLAWDHAALHALFRRNPALEVALTAHLNIDLARKVAISVPGNTEPPAGERIIAFPGT